MRKLSSTAWLLAKAYQLLKVVYFGLEFLVILAFTIIAYTFMLPFMALIFLVRFIVKLFGKKGERVNVQPIKPRT